MSSPKSSVSDFKESARAVAARRLRELFAKGNEYTFGRLVDLIGNISSEELFLVLGDLAKNHEISVIFRVESNAGGGIGDFSDINDIPREIFDPRTDSTLAVRSENIRLLYASASHAL